MPLSLAAVLPAQPPAPAPGALRRALDALAPLLGPPARALTAARRRAFAGRLFPEAPLLVRAAAAGLLAEPALFSELSVSGAGLAARQDRADLWRDLRDHLQQLAAQANDLYLQEQAAAIDEALALLRHVEAGAASSIDRRPIHTDRRLALGEALAVFARLRRRARRHALKRGRPRADLTTTPPDKDVP